MSVDISVSITEDKVDIIATPTVNIVNVTNSASIDPGLYDLSEFTNTSPNPFVRTSGLSSYVPTSRTLTINGTTQDLSADRTFTISTGITIGTTAITSGTVGRVLFEGTGNVVQESANLFWDNTNGRLGIGANSPTSKLFVRADGASGLTQPFRVETSASRLLLQTEDGGTTRIGGPTARLYVNVESGGIAHSLVVNGSVHFGGGIGNAGANFFDSGGTSSASRIIQYDGSGSPKNLITANGASYIQGGNLLINTTTDAGFRLDVNGTARVQGNAQFGTGFYWDNTNARLGIGTSSPSTTLHVVGQATISTALSISGGFVMTEAGNVHTFTAPATNRTIRFITNSQSFSLFSTGNLGINTTTDAGFRLDVNGTARVNSTTTTGLTITQGASGDAIVIQNAGYIQMASTRFRAFDSAFQFQNISYNTKVNLSMSGFSYFNSGGNYTFGSTTEVFTALLNLDSTTRGFLPPRMTTTQKNAIASPATGLQVYDTTLNRPCFYDGTTWITL